MTALPHAVVDVFSTEPFEGSPVAVVLEADRLCEQRIRSLVEWFPHEETVFVLSPTEEGADFRTRAFRAQTEVRFAGLSTLAAARAWLDRGGAPAAGRLVQQSDIGLTAVEVQDGTSLRFAAPSQFDRGEPDDLTVEIIREVLGLEASRVREAAWLDAGSGFLGLLVDSAETVMAMEPSIAELGQHLVGVLGPHEPGGPADVELRSFTPSRRIDEPRAAATLSAAFATWLVPRGLMPPSFTVAQGRAVGHIALMTVAVESDATWVGGAVISRSAGTLEA